MQVPARTFAILGHVFFLMMAALALYFYEERGATFDDAQYFVTMTKNGSFRFSHGRIGAFLPQIFTIIGLKLNLGLKLSLMVYSLSYVLAGWITWAFIHYFTRQYLLGFALVLSQLILFKSIFFWPVSEALLASNWAFCLVAVLNAQGEMKDWIRYGLMVLFSFLAIFTHPTAIFMCVGSYWLYFLTGNEGRMGARLIKVVGWSALAAGLHIIKGVPPYEAEVGLSAEKFWSRLPIWADSANLRAFMNDLKGYIPILLLFFGGVLGLLVAKRWFAGIGMVGLALVYFFLTLLAFFYGEILAIIHQNSMVPIAFFAVIVGLAGLGRLFQEKWIPIALFCLLTLFMLSRVRVARWDINNRFAMHEHLMDFARQFPERKGVFLAKFSPLNSLQVNWVFGMETMIRSSLKWPDDPIALVVVDDVSTYMKPELEETCIPGPPFWPFFGYHEMREAYFPVKHTRWRFFSNAECGQVQQKTKVEMEFLDLQERWSSRSRMVTLQVNNTGDGNLCSGAQTPFDGWMKYWFSDLNGNIVEDKLLNLPIPWDIPAHTQCRLPVDVMSNLGPGEYNLCISLNDGEGVLAKVEGKVVFE